MPVCHLFTIAIHLRIGICYLSASRYFSGCKCVIDIITNSKSDGLYTKNIDSNNFNFLNFIFRMN